MQSLHDCYWSIHNDITPPTTRRVPITLSMFVKVLAPSTARRAVVQSVVHL